MFLPQILSITAARSKIFDLAEKVQRPGTFFTLTEKGRAKAVMISAEEFESWRETLEVRRIFPDLAKDVATARRGLKSGRYVTLQNFLTNANKKYAVRGHSAKKSPKGSRKN